MVITLNYIKSRLLIVVINLISLYLTFVYCVARVGILTFRFWIIGLHCFHVFSYRSASGAGALTWLHGLRTYS